MGTKYENIADRGILPIRLTTAQITALTTPGASLSVYDTDKKKLAWYDGSRWINRTIMNNIISPTAFTGNVNDYNPTDLVNSEIIRIDCSGANREITGLVAQENGRVITILNIGASGDLKFKNENASSTAANRFALNGDLTIKTDGGVTIMYDATSARWRVMTNGF